MHYLLVHSLVLVLHLTNDHFIFSTIFQYSAIQTWYGRVVKKLFYSVWVYLTIISSLYQSFCRNNTLILLPQAFLHLKIWNLFLWIWSKVWYVEHHQWIECSELLYDFSPDLVLLSCSKYLWSPDDHTFCIHPVRNVECLLYTDKVTYIVLFHITDVI